MREAKIILPLFDNDGNSLSLVHASLREDLCEVFGGYTATKGEGGWKDASDHRHEPVVVYWVGASDEMIERESLLKDVAIKHAKLAMQHSVYLVGFNGRASIWSSTDELEAA